MFAGLGKFRTLITCEVGFLVAFFFSLADGLILVLLLDRRAVKHGCLEWAFSYSPFV